MLRVKLQFRCDSCVIQGRVKKLHEGTAGSGERGLKQLQLLSCERVDSGDGVGVAQLRDDLSAHCRKLRYFNEAVPRSWLSVEALFDGMIASLGHVVDRDDAVRYINDRTRDLGDAWSAVEFWAVLGRVFVHGRLLVPDIHFIIGLTKPLIHWKPVLMPNAVDDKNRDKGGNPELCAGALLRFGADRDAAMEHLAVLQHKCILDVQLLDCFACWSELDKVKQRAMLSFLSDCKQLQPLNPRDGGPC